MAATMKLSLLTFILLLSSELVVVLGHAGDPEPEVTCAGIRCIQGGNITCENHEEVIQGCSCVCAPKHAKGCVLHLQSGSNQNCNTTNC